MESRKPKSRRKNQKLGTIVHLPTSMDAILKKIILTLQAASAYTHFRGGVMGSNADFMENALKPPPQVPGDPGTAEDPGGPQGIPGDPGASQGTPCRGSRGIPGDPGGPQRTPGAQNVGKNLMKNLGPPRLAE